MTSPLTPASSIASALAFALVATPSLASSYESEDALGSQASPEDEGDITVTATRTPVKIEEAPATVTIITAEDIADQLATDYATSCGSSPASPCVAHPPGSALPWVAPGALAMRIS